MTLPLARPFCTPVILKISRNGVRGSSQGISIVIDRRLIYSERVLLDRILNWVYNKGIVSNINSYTNLYQYTNILNLEYTMYNIIRKDLFSFLNFPRVVDGAPNQKDNHSSMELARR